MLGIFDFSGVRIRKEAGLKRHNHPSISGVACIKYLICVPSRHDKEDIAIRQQRANSDFQRKADTKADALSIRYC